MMTTTSISLKPWCVRWAGAALALATLIGAGTAQAHGDVVWSVGVQSPGISVGVANTRPVIVAAAPSYYAPPPPVYYAPRPVYMAPPHHGYYGKHHHKHYYKHHHKHHKHRRHDHYDRD